MVEEDEEIDVVEAVEGAPHYVAEEIFGKTLRTGGGDLQIGPRKGGSLLWI